jgi:hypothetical protein
MSTGEAASAATAWVPGGNGALRAHRTSRTRGLAMELGERVIEIESGGRAEGASAILRWDDHTS